MPFAEGSTVQDQYFFKTRSTTSPGGKLPESLMDICFRQSKLCAQMRYLRFAGRIFRRLVWETVMDDTTGLAAQMAYQFLFTLAPGLLFLTSIC